MKTKTFPLRVVLTVTTGRLLTESKGPNDNGIIDLYKILGWMTDDEPFTHQLPRFGEECTPWLLRWFPELKSVDTPKNMARLDKLIENAEIRKESIDKAVEMWLKTCGCKSHYDVPKIPRDDHTRINPVTELANKLSKRKSSKGES